MSGRYRDGMNDSELVTIRVGRGTLETCHKLLSERTRTRLTFAQTGRAAFGALMASLSGELIPTEAVQATLAEHLRRHLAPMVAGALKRICRDTGVTGLDFGITTGGEVIVTPDSGRPLVFDVAGTVVPADELPLTGPGAEA